jgi:hypothetical protein
MVGNISRVGDWDADSHSYRAIQESSNSMTLPSESTSSRQSRQAGFEDDRLSTGETVTFMGTLRRANGKDLRTGMTGKILEVHADSLRVQFEGIGPVRCMASELVIQVQESDEFPAPLSFAAASAILGPPSAKWEDVWTVMVRNVPTKYIQEMFLEELHSLGFHGLFDFLHLPVYAETARSKGYAFINFTNPLYSWIFKWALEGRRMTKCLSRKAISISPASLQGYAANYHHYHEVFAQFGESYHVSSRPLFLREQPLEQQPSHREDPHLLLRGPVSKAIPKMSQHFDAQPNSMVDASENVPRLPMCSPPAAPERTMLSRSGHAEVCFCHICGSKRPSRSSKYCCYCGTMFYQPDLNPTGGFQ